MKKVKISAISLLIIAAFFSCSKNDDSSNDNTAPVITITGSNPIVSQKDSAYIDPGATAIDDVDGDITGQIVTTDNVNIHVIGTYNVNNSVSDKAGNTAKASREVKVLIY